jgi:tetratricopeptide (TPR) repeat protein
VSAAGSSRVGLRATSCAREFAQASWLLRLLLIILAGTLWTETVALGDEREASLKATHGRAALLRGQYQAAETLLTDALQSSTLPIATQVSALDNRGVARWRLRKFTQAIDDFNAALKLAPDEAVLYNNRGNVLLELRHNTEATKDFSQAIALVPSYGPAYNNRGNARLFLGDYVAAIADFTKAVALMPTNPVPFNGRGKAQLALKRPAAALRDFSRAIVLSTRYGQAYANRAEALVALRRFTDAVNDYTSAINFGKETAQVYLGRAAAYTSLNKPGRAFADLARAKESDVQLTTAAAEQTSSISEGTNQSTDAGAWFHTANSRPVTNLPCEAAAERFGDGPQDLRQVADARHAPEPESLVLRASDEVLIGNAEPAGPGDAIGFPCARESKRQSEPAPSAAAEPSGDRSVGPEMEGWTVVLTQSGEYIARNSAYPKLRLALEMYGSGEPGLLNWQLLRDSLRGVGLMHYYAGTSAEGERLEYIAVIDIWAGRLIAIEPARWGERQAEWTWTDRTVEVVDPQGVPSRVQVRAETFERPLHLKRIKRVSRLLPLRFSYQPGRRILPYRSGFNPWALR